MLSDGKSLGMSHGISQGMHAPNATIPHCTDLYEEFVDREAARQLEESIASTLVRIPRPSTLVRAAVITSRLLPLMHSELMNLTSSSQDEA